MVEIFHEIKRVLKPEGAIFLNIGDSYFGSGGAHKTQHANPGLSKSASRGGGPHESSYDKTDKELEGYLMNGCFSENLCDECLSVLTHKSHKDLPPFPMPTLLPSLPIHEHKEFLLSHFPTLDSFLKGYRTLIAIQDLEHIANLEYEQLHAFLLSKFYEFYRQYQGGNLQTSIQDVSAPLFFETLQYYVLLCAHKFCASLNSFDYTPCISKPSEQQEQSNQHISGYCSLCGSYSYTLKTYIKPQSYTKFSTLPNKLTLKPKDLVGIPWMLAFALRADGWYLRQDIIWAKPNPMPESVTDRCTKAHEYIFLLSKSQRYYYDVDSIREPLSESTLNDIRIGCKTGRVGSKAHKLVLNGTHGKKGIGDPSKTRAELHNLNGRNKRSVWTVNTKPYSEAHFATFPEELIVDCIKAGCPADGLVLDPFMGAGTTGLVAKKLHRNYLGIELNPAYITIAENRISKEIGLFN
jgi:hypothetical protein